MKIVEHFPPVPPLNLRYTYVANDGKVFTDMGECSDYEKKNILIEKMKYIDFMEVPLGRNGVSCLGSYYINTEEELDTIYDWFRLKGYKVNRDDYDYDWSYDDWGKGWYVVMEVKGDYYIHSVHGYKRIAGLFFNYFPNKEETE